MAFQGISSLAKETDKLDYSRDASGATCINQYVVVKTLGYGSFGKVKLCLNTLDGNLYAIKVTPPKHSLNSVRSGVLANLIPKSDFLPAAPHFSMVMNMSLLRVPHIRKLFAPNAFALPHCRW
jgi:serine/threonine protein kinase